MIKIVGLPTSITRKMTILGVDFSVAYAKQWQAQRLVPIERVGRMNIYKDLTFYYENLEEYDTITHRLIFWRFKLEVKTIVQRQTAYA